MLRRAPEAVARLPRREARAALAPASPVTILPPSTRAKPGSTASTPSRSRRPEPASLMSIGRRRIHCSRIQMSTGNVTAASGCSSSVGMNSSSSTSGRSGAGGVSGWWRACGCIGRGRGRPAAPADGGAALSWPSAAAHSIGDSRSETNLCTSFHGCTLIANCVRSESRRRRAPRRRNREPPHVGRVTVALRQLAPRTRARCPSSGRADRRRAPSFRPHRERRNPAPTRRRCRRDRRCRRRWPR